jgi:hypothetical protein
VASSWTRRYYTGFLNSKPCSWKYSHAVRNLTAPAISVGSVVRVLNMKEIRDLLARIKFFYHGTLSRTRTDVAELLPSAMTFRPEHGATLLMTNELVKVSSDGVSAILMSVLLGIVSYPLTTKE